MTGVFGVVLGQILLMFLYLIIGYVLYRTGLITQEGSKALAHLLLYCVLPCVVLKSFCIEYSAKGAVELAVSIAAGAGVLLLSMAVSWFFFRKDPMAADRHGAHHCECGPHRQQHRGICPASGAGFFLRCADGLPEHSAVADHAAGDAQPGCRVGLCLSLKTTNRKQETR